MSQDHKKVGVATNTIINPRYEKFKAKQEAKIKKGKNCNKCGNYNKKQSWCYKFKFKVSTIELGSKCKEYVKIDKKVFIKKHSK